MLLELAIDFEVLPHLFETFALDLLHVAIACLERLISPLQLLSLLLDILVEAIIFHLRLLILTLQGLGLGLVLHQLTGIVIVVLLQFLKLPSLLEQSLRGSTALILQDLLLFEVCTFGSLHELVSVVLVSHFQVIKSIGECLDLFLAFSQLAIKLITVSLQLFLFLGCFDDIVGLRMLTSGLCLS